MMTIYIYQHDGFELQDLIEAKIMSRVPSYQYYGNDHIVGHNVRRLPYDKTENKIIQPSRSRIYLS